MLEQASAGRLDGLQAIDRVGAWWGQVPQPTPENPRLQTEGELEIIAAQGDRVRLAGEAKWTREPVGFGILNHLRDVAQYIPGVTGETRLALFARAFEERLAAEATSEGVLLVTPEQLYQEPSA